MKIVGIAGSLRKGSLNRGLVTAAAEVLPTNVEVTSLDIRLPLYDGDIDTDEARPAEVTRFIAAVGGADGVMIATPEYNYGIPGPLKNALDWASRPAYRSVFAGKKTMVIGAAASIVGTARAQGQLKQVLLGMAAEVFAHPEMLVGAAHTKFDDAGKLTDTATRDYLRDMLAGFVAWVRP